MAIGPGTLLEMWSAADGGSGYDRPLRTLTALVGVLIGALVLGAGVFVVYRYVLTPLLSEALPLRDPVIGLRASW